MVKNVIDLNAKFSQISWKILSCVVSILYSNAGLRHHLVRSARREKQGSGLEWVIRP